MPTHQTKTQIFHVVEAVVHKHKAYAAGSTIRLTPRQAANWLAGLAFRTKAYIN